MFWMHPWVYASDTFSAPYPTTVPTFHKTPSHSLSLFCRHAVFLFQHTLHPPTHTHPLLSSNFSFPKTLSLSHIPPIPSPMDSSHPNSRDSSPRSREFDTENPSFDDPSPPTFKVKLLCSYGGKIQPRPHDNHLIYFGGDTKIIAVDRNIKFSALKAKLCSLTNADISLKYQLPGEDLDALISVTNEEDLDHMMVEYDRMCRSSPRPARLRLFLFQIQNSSSVPTVNFGFAESKPHWFVDAINSVHIPSLEASPQPTTVPSPNPDFLFGFDTAYPATTPPEFSFTPPTVPVKNSAAELERAVGESDIPELQKKNEQNVDEENDKGNGGDCFSGKNSENVASLSAHAHSHVQVHPVPVQVPGPVPVHNNLGGAYSVPVFPVSATGNEPFYYIQTPSGMYHPVQPAIGPAGQTVYLIQTQPPLSLSHSHSAQKIGYNGSEVGVVSDSHRGFSQVALPQQAAVAPGGDGWN